MKIISKVAAIALLVFTIIPAVAASAQTDCAVADYCTPETPDSGGSDAGGGAGVAPVDDVQGGGADVIGGGAEAPDAAGAGAGAVTAPSGALPITGGDVVGIAAFGAAAIALGTLLVKRSKAARQLA